MMKRKLNQIKLNEFKVVVFSNEGEKRGGGGEMAVM